MPSAAVVAQAPPAAGTILKEIERTAPKPLPPAISAPLHLPAEAPPTEEERNRIKVLVRDFRITGATLIPEAELKAQLSPYIGKELTFSELRRASLFLSEYYRTKGYFARALIPEQTVNDGVIHIVIIEGRLSEIKIETLPGTRISQDRIRAYIESAERPGDPLRPDSIQSALRNLNDLPGVSTAGVLQPGAAAGAVDLAVRAEEGPLVNGGVTLDNYGLKATGAARAIVDASLNDPTGHGDQLTATGFVTDRSKYARTGYSFPVGYSGLRLGANAAELDYHLSGAFAGFNGYAQIEGLTLSRPLFRSISANLFGGLALDHKHFVNNGAGSNISDKVSNSFSISGSGDSQDSWLGGGRSAASFILVNGRLDLSANPSDLAADNAGAHTQGNFDKLEWTFTRLQTLPLKNTVLSIAIAGQQAGKNLDAYEQISLGGPVAVRAYPTGQALGDQGWVANVELHHTIEGNLEAYGFYDAGYITVVKNPFPGSNSTNPNAPNGYYLQGAGIGAQYVKVGNFALRGALAFKIGPNPGRDANGNDIDGAHSHSRVWLQAIKFF